ncbi:TonB-dependent receptor [Porticoccaceae bacterium LTM1]|nr:TonB-dependent receptor [Porticoccaceae bacterium LTM1]
MSKILSRCRHVVGWELGSSTAKKRLATFIASAILSGVASASSIEDDVVIINFSMLSMDEALLKLGEESGVKVIFSNDLVEGHVSKAISGKMTVATALNRILDGTDLKYEVSKDNVVVITQDVDAKKDRADPIEEVEEIVVVGSALKGGDPSAPITIYTREDLMARGVFSVEEFLRTYSGSTTVLNSATSAEVDINPNLLTLDAMYDKSDGIQGQAAANIAGFGIGSTLVLINNRRTAASPVLDNGFVDLNSIPFEEIERIEVLEGGASSRYGSDAVGGVVNIVTRRSRGTSSATTFRVDNSRNGGDRYNLSQVLNYGWQDGSVRLTLNKSESKPISSEKAGWTTMDLTDRGGYDRRLQSEPHAGGAVYRWGPGRTFRMPNGSLYTLPDGTVYTYTGFGWDALPSENDGTDYSDDDWSPENLQPSEQGIREFLSPHTRQKSASLRVEQDFGEYRLWSDLSWNENSSQTQQTTLAIGPFSSPVYVPESNAFNTFGEDVRAIYTFHNEMKIGQLPQMTANNIATTKRFNFGVAGPLAFLDDWEFTFDGGVSSSESLAWQTRLDTSECGYDARGNALAGYYDTATGEFYENVQDIPSDAVYGVDYKYGCYEGAESLWSKMLASSNPDEAINLFGNGSVQSPFLSEMLYERYQGNPVRLNYRTRVEFTGPVYELPGGEVWGHIGFDFNRDVTDYSKADFRRLFADTQNGKVNRDTAAVYYEVRVPIVGEANAVPGVESLAFNIQGRYSDFDTPESRGQQKYNKTTPQYSLSWKPRNDLTLSVRYTESFKAPTNFQQINAESDFADPSKCFGAADMDPTKVDESCWLDMAAGELKPLPWESRPDDSIYPTWLPFAVDLDGYRDATGEWLEGEQPLFYGNVARISFGVLDSLRPETSEDWNYSVQWNPEFLTGLSMRLDYRQVDYTDRIETFNYYDEGHQDYLYTRPDLYWEHPETDQLMVVRFLPSNQTINERRSLTFNLGYYWDTDWGSFNSRLRGTYVGTHQYQLSDATPLQTMVGRYDKSGPKQMKGSLEFGWSYGFWNLNLTGHYSDDYAWNDQILDTSTWRLIDNYVDVEEYWSVDLTASYSDRDSGWSVYAGARNLTNTDFPFINDRAGQGFDSSVVSPGGRTLYLSVSKQFDFD